MNTTQINVESHLKEFAINKWGIEEKETVKFPSHTELYFTIYDLLMKRPIDFPTDIRNLEIMIPSRREDVTYGCRKNPEVYNYISESGCRIINRKLETIFWAELHELLDEYKHRGKTQDRKNKYIEIVHVFMCRYKIESISEDALLKNYYRWREMLRQMNIRGYKKIKC